MLQTVSRLLVVLLVFSVVMMTVLHTDDGKVSATVSDHTTSVWSTPVNISQNAGTSRSLGVAKDDFGNVHAVWTDNSQYPYDTRVFYRMRSPDGAWSPIDVLPYAVVPTCTDVAFGSDGTVHLAQSS